jgi:hypothetical protein
MYSNVAVSVKTRPRGRPMAPAHSQISLLSKVDDKPYRFKGTITMEDQDQKSPGAKKPVWFITGCSTGFGRELAKHVLERGYRTVVA